MTDQRTDTPRRHMRQSGNGCVTCPKRWSEHTLAEAMPDIHGAAAESAAAEPPDLMYHSHKPHDESCPDPCHPYLMSKAYQAGWRAAQPPRGSQPDTWRETGNRSATEIAAKPDLLQAGGSLTATEPPAICKCGQGCVMPHQHRDLGEDQPPRGVTPALTLERLTDAAHHSMCDVSHHDSQTVCKNQRLYELIAQSMYARLGSPEDSE